MTKQREMEKKARDLIVKALAEYHGGEPGAPEFTAERIPPGKYHLRLTSEGIDNSITCLMLINNMSAGSSSRTAVVDLHKLLHNYLLDVDVRDEINDVLFKTLEQSVKKRR